MAIAGGRRDARSISAETGLSAPRAYGVVGSLRGKGMAEKRGREVAVARSAFPLALSRVLSDSPGSIAPLSDSGLDVLAALCVPGTAEAVSAESGLARATVYRKMDEMGRMGMVAKRGGAYGINDALWPGLRGLAGAYVEHRALMDERVPRDAEVYRGPRGLLLFSCRAQTGFAETAFSAYRRFGVDVRPEVNYYCGMASEPSLEDAFEHSLRVIERDPDWRKRMAALIFYVKHRDPLGAAVRPETMEMERVLSGERVEGWAPLGEMRERAEMYGVDLSRYGR